MTDIGLASRLAQALVYDPMLAAQVVVRALDEVGGPHAGALVDVLPLVRQHAEAAAKPVRMGSDDADVVAAFYALPVRARAALWLDEVEGLPPGEIATAVGLAPGVAASYLARARLRALQGYAGRQAARNPAPACAPVLARIPAYRTGTLKQAQLARLEEHLAACDTCRAHLRAATDLRGGLLPIAAAAAPPMDTAAAPPMDTAAAPPMDTAAAPPPTVPVIPMPPAPEQAPAAPRRRGKGRKRALLVAALLVAAVGTVFGAVRLLGDDTDGKQAVESQAAPTLARPTTTSVAPFTSTSTSAARPSSTVGGASTTVAAAGSPPLTRGPVTLNFANLTFHAPAGWEVIMEGNRGFMGRPADNRRNLVLTRDYDGSVENLKPMNCSTPNARPTAVALVDTGFRNIGDRVADYRFWRLTCDNGIIEEHRAWLFPVSRIGIYEQVANPDNVGVVSTADIK